MAQPLVTLPDGRQGMLKSLDYTSFPLTQQVHNDWQTRIRVVDFGRRSGKSYMALGEGFLLSYRFHEQGIPNLRGVIVAPTNKMLRENWWMAQVIYREWITQSIVSEQRLHLGALGQVDFVSTESQGGAGRGAGYNWAIVDEASRVPKDAWESDLRPALSDRHGHAVIISTPNGLNWFYDLYQQGQQGDPAIKSYRASTLDCWESRFAQSPDRLVQAREEWDLLKRTTSESKFRQEFMAEFLAGEGQLFSLKSALYRGNLREQVAGRHYVAGVDVARKDDWMVTVIIEVESQQVVGLARSRHQDWGLQKAVALALLDRYPGVLTYVDSTGVGDPIAQDLRRAGINVMDVIFTPRTKSELVENLLTAIDQTYLGIPDQAETQWLIEELKQYESVKMPSGILRYGAPEGRHDDGVTALMLACWGLQGSWRTLELAQTLQPNWWERSDNPWEHLEYEHRLAQFRQRYPQRPLPMHPTDLAWTLMERV